MFGKKAGLRFERGQDIGTREVPPSSFQPHVTES
jgi:hypothetical protein